MISKTAEICGSAHISSTANVWDYAQVREDAVIGNFVIIGRGVYIGAGVHVGDNSKIQNYALIYEPADIAAGVFIGPSVVLTNDRQPRAINPDGSQKSTSDWERVGVNIRIGASIGAGAICVAPVTIGGWSMVAAGSVVIHDVPDFALVAGVPAVQIGWVGRLGSTLEKSEDSQELWTCAISGSQYRQIGPQELVEINEMDNKNYK